MNLSKEQENSYLAQHFDKLDKDFANIVKASKTRDMFVKSIEFMETLRDQEANKKLIKKEVGKGKQAAMSTANTSRIVVTATRMKSPRVVEDRATCPIAPATNTTNI